NFANEYKKCRNYIIATSLNEIETLETLFELAPDDQNLHKYINEKSALIHAAAETQALGVDQLMSSMAKDMGLNEINLKLNRLEKKAMSITPNETALVKANGYSGYRSALSSISREDASRFRSSIANTSELQLMCNGKHNALEIKILLDAEYQRDTDLSSLLDYLKVLKDSGLITY
ncbi:MAG: hypothetical protein J7L96_08675, partial [Bacteroidales bacterium]|nr:hypothetical protein [Bacteroidales bacterium]